MNSEEIFFYPHGYLRDRQLDTVNNWKGPVANPDIGSQKGAQVSSKKSLKRNSIKSWKNRLPLINIKRRPVQCSKDQVVYVWGGLIGSGNYIVELDNPFSLTGYNLNAFYLYKRIIKWMLLQDRCRQIRCISHACKQTLIQILGRELESKISVCYPHVSDKRSQAFVKNEDEPIRFLFVSTQFDIKGGRELLEAFNQLAKKYSNIHLNLVTNLPDMVRDQVLDNKQVSYFPAKFSREELSEKFFASNDVLIHPTFVDSFGMVVLEALSHGMAIIASDVYAISEMILPEKNGFLLEPTISIWNKSLPTKNYYKIESIADDIDRADHSSFVSQLYAAIEQYAVNPNLVQQHKEESAQLLQRRFLVCH